MGTLPQAQKQAHKSILVVEDDVDIRETLSGLLSSEGYAVGTCSNGLEALERLRHGDQPDVIVLDLMMPVMDGWQFRVHQKSDPRLATIPVLAISADTTPKAAAIDADAYLKKPVDYDTLLATIERTLLDLERRRLQVAQAETERLASLGTLAAGVAHEINNPLAYVIANLGYVADALGGDGAFDRAQARDAVDEARGGCERIRAIVRGLQTFSRGAGDDKPRAIDVKRVLDSTVSIAANEVRARAQLVKDYGELPPAMANEAQLGQVVLNLLLNAAQAIPEGDATRHEVRLAARVEGPQIVIEVKDTGEGIRPEIRSRIFDPFFTTKPVGVGTGLGLSIAHRLVTSMKGELGVESEPGRGATFRVRLPMAKDAKDVADKKKTNGAAKPARAAARAKVLVIDDEEMIGVMLTRVLGHAHDVESTTHPNEAIDRVQRGERFDVILCDLMMPERSGPDVYATIATIAPEQAERMLFLTGGAFSPKAQAFLVGRGQLVVEKPFVVSDLLARVDAVIAARGPIAKKK